MLSTGRQQAGLERGRLKRRAYDDTHDKSDSCASQTSVVRTTERRDAHERERDTALCNRLPLFLNTSR